MNKFTPQCLSNNESYAIDNRNTLLPCCYVDNFGHPKNKLLENLIKVSNIDDHDSIEDIIKQKEWQDFYRILVEAKKTNNLKKLPEACKVSCVNDRNVRVEKWQDLG